MNITLWRMIRELLGITMEEVAEIMNCTRQTVCNIEKGKSSTGMSLQLYVLAMRIVVDRNQEEVKKLKTDLRTIMEFLEEA